MEEWLPAVLTLVVFGAIVWGVLRGQRPAPYFAVHLVGGEPRAALGTVTPGFLACVREVAADHRVTAGRVWGVVRGGGRISLKFSGHFPPAAQQRIRNWWAASGWTATRRRK